MLSTTDLLVKTDGEWQSKHIWSFRASTSNQNHIAKISSAITQREHLDRCWEPWHIYQNSIPVSLVGKQLCHDPSTKYAIPKQETDWNIIPASIEPGSVLGTDLYKRKTGGRSDFKTLLAASLASSWRPRTPCVQWNLIIWRGPLATTIRL